jgi:hypothetical protein
MEYSVFGSPMIETIAFSPGLYKKVPFALISLGCDGAWLGGADSVDETGGGGSGADETRGGGADETEGDERTGTSEKISGVDDAGADSCGTDGAEASVGTAVVDCDDVYVLFDNSSFNLEISSLRIDVSEYNLSYKFLAKLNFEFNLSISSLNSELSAIKE